MKGSVKENKGPKGAPYYVQYGRVFKRFWSIKEAERFLTGLRFKEAEGSFDERDYRQTKPLGFRTLAEQWLEIKREEVKKSSYVKLHHFMSRAIDHWEFSNIKEIRYAEIDDFVRAQRKIKTGEQLSSKYKSNMVSCLHSFWVWLVDREVLQPSQMPKFPKIKA